MPSGKKNELAGEKEQRSVGIDKKKNPYFFVLLCINLFN
jgi:hypothetical protein